MAALRRQNPVWPEGQRVTLYRLRSGLHGPVQERELAMVVEDAGPKVRILRLDGRAMWAPRHLLEEGWQSVGRKKNPYRFKSKPADGYVHLQYIGDVRGKPVEQLRPGDRLMWNSGVTSTVVEVRPKSAKTVVLVERYSDGRVYERTKKIGTLVALARR